MEQSDIFEVRRDVPEYTYSLAITHKDNRQAAPWVIGHCIKRKYTNPANPNYAPRSIIDDFSKDFGINMTYEKAWRCREKALLYVRGTVDGSYQKLPSYLYMLEKTNPGTVTHL